MTMRAEIFSKIQQAIGDRSSNKKRLAAVENRLKSPTSGPLPSVALSPGKLVSLFKQKLDASAATLEACKASDAPEAVLRFIREHNLPTVCRIGGDPRLADLLLAQKSVLEIKAGPSDGNDLTTISHALAAFAETGTLVLESGPDNPTTLNFLAENHIVVLNRKSLKLHQEDIWEMLRKNHGPGNMPRTVNLVTGPSRSADIEQTLILGAHGPIRLHVILIEDR